MKQEPSHLRVGVSMMCVFVQVRLFRKEDGKQVAQTEPQLRKFSGAVKTQGFSHPSPPIQRLALIYETKGTLGRLVHLIPISARKILEKLFFTLSNGSKAVHREFPVQVDAGVLMEIQHFQSVLLQIVLIVSNDLSPSAR
jgi:hypothetical protein